ncbi:hypothetical protein [Xylella fastidiosa]|uniref:hypothetical protein n=1 Tax=Xylella fastidiosa TaxID=2371 RepID=UPI003984AD32
MSDDTNTATVSFEAVTPPTNDAQAALQEQQQQPTPEPSSEPPSATGEADKQPKRKRKQGNRTRECVQRINGENNELRRRLKRWSGSSNPSLRVPATRRRQGRKAHLGLKTMPITGMNGRTRVLAICSSSGSRNSSRPKPSASSTVPRRVMKHVPQSFECAP